MLAALYPFRPQKAAPSYLALGDSYTIGESVEDSERYPVQALHQLFPGSRPEIIATTGWTTGNLLDALTAANPSPGYQAVSLLIGVNNQYQGRSQTEYREQFTALLKAAIRLAGNRPGHVLVLSIPDYSVTPFARGSNTAPVGQGPVRTNTPVGQSPVRTNRFIAAQIDSFNAINYRIASEFGANYLDVTTESRKALVDPGLIAADGLHFSGKEYAIWAKKMEPWLLTALSQQ
jgi:lysophospholipase L1-like esterase